MGAHIKRTVSVLIQKDMTADNVLFQKWYLTKNVQAMPTKTGSWYLLGVLFKIAD